MKNINDSIVLLKEKCKEHNLKLTPQRIAIYEAIWDTKKHPSADHVYKKIKRKFQSISFDTVNRTLQTFSRIGLLKVVEGQGDPKRFDPNLKKHHHVRCLKCGLIADFYYEEYDNIKVPNIVKKQFTVIDKKVLIEGICADCRTKEK